MRNGGLWHFSGKPFHPGGILFLLSVYSIRNQKHQWDKHWIKEGKSEWIYMITYNILIINYFMEID